MSHTRNTNRIKPRGLIQASSHKPQALELDNSQNMGYSRTITDGNARLAQPNAGPSIPPGSKPIKDLMKAVASPEVGTSSPENLHAENSFRFTNPEPTSNKQNKLASRQTSKQSLPLKDHRSWILEQVSESPDQESGLR